MPPRYTNITLQEMKNILEALGFEYVDMRSINDYVTTEYVFQKYLDKGNKQYTLRIYTSVSKYTDDSRDVGTDAIRLVIYTDGKHIAEGRTNRTQNWKKNLVERITKWNEMFKLCPQCGNVLKERVGKFGMFMGCTSYPQCGYTERV